MNTQLRSATAMLVNQRGKARAGIASPAHEPAASVKQPSITAKKATRSLKTSKMARQSAPSSQAAAQRSSWCAAIGRADLAPSFSKRRDARCRACFKQRYGSATGSTGPLSFPRGEPRTNPRPEPIGKGRAREAAGPAFLGDIVHDGRMTKRKGYELPCAGPLSVSHRAARRPCSVMA